MKNIKHALIFISTWLSTPAQNIDSLKTALRNSTNDTTTCSILVRLTETLPEEKGETYNARLKEIADSYLKKTGADKRLKERYEQFQAIAIHYNGLTYYSRGENPKALESFYEALKIFEKIHIEHSGASGNKKNLAECLTDISNICQQMGDVSKALEYNKRSLQVREEMNDKHGITETLNSISIIYKNQGNVVKALEYQNKNLKMLEDINDKHGMAISLNNLGSIYNDIGDIARALECLSKSLKLYEEISDKHDIAYALNNIGNLYYARGDSSIALNYYQKSLKIRTENGDKQGMASSFVSIGNIYKDKNNLPEALNYYSKSLKIREELALLPGIAQSLNLVGGIYDLQNQPVKALELYQKGLTIYEEINDKKGIALTLLNLAKHHLKLNEPKQALFYSSRSLQISRELGYPRSILSAAEVLKTIYERSRDYAKALEMYELFIQMRDSINNENIQKASLKQQINYEYEKKLSTLKEKQAKDQALYAQRRKYYLLVGTGMVLFLGILFYLAYTRFRLRKEKENQHMLILVKDSEIKALQAQMNPHFIFNSLNSILEFIRKSEKEPAIKYLTKFSRLVRMVLEFSGKKFIPLTDELEMLNIYISLENLRFGDSFIFALEVDPGIDLQDTEIPALLIQPFIENAIIHGLQNKKKLMQEQNKPFPGKLSLSLVKQGENLKCTIEDNGVGREKAEEIKKNKVYHHTSMGMRVTKDRLDLLSRNNCKINFFDLKDADNIPSGTRVEILIPLLENY